MAINPETDFIAGPFTSNGSSNQKMYFDFPVTSQSQVGIVCRDIATGEVSDEFEVVGFSGGNDGGYVRISALTGLEFVLFSNVEEEQPFTFLNTGMFLPSRVSSALDRLTRLLMQFTVKFGWVDWSRGPDAPPDLTVNSLTDAEGRDLVQIVEASAGAAASSAAQSAQSAVESGQFASTSASHAQSAQGFAGNAGTSESIAYQSSQIALEYRDQASGFADNAAASAEAAAAQTDPYSGAAAFGPPNTGWDDSYPYWASGDTSNWVTTMATVYVSHINRNLSLVESLELKYTNVSGGPLLAGHIGGIPDFDDIGVVAGNVKWAASNVYVREIAGLVTVTDSSGSQLSQERLTCSLGNGYNSLGTATATVITVSRKLSDGTLHVPEVPPGGSIRYVLKNFMVRRLPSP